VKTSACFESHPGKINGTKKKIIRKYYLTQTPPQTHFFNQNLGTIFSGSFKGNVA
jgi:hypothetical protein